MSWQRVRSEFEALLDRAPEQREQRLRELATTDQWLAAQVRDLLQQDAGAGTYLERGGAAFAAPAPAAALATGQHFGRFRLVRPLGSGGMGSVWEAEQQDPRRRVALKLLVRGARSDEERWRFRHEVQVLAGLQHPAIATFFEAGEDEIGGSQVAWLAMELVDGARDVLAWADEHGLDLAARLALFERLTDAVAFGHRRGVLHRDLKPGNVLVGADGRLKLIDFGIARAVGNDDDGGAFGRTRTGEIVGTLQFMAPEQLQGDHAAVGTASDVYALGGLLYHLVCGRAPFDFAGQSVAAIARLALEQEPVAPRRARPDLPVDLGCIVLKALEKDPARRYATVDDLRADLERFRVHEPVVARPAGVLYRARKFVRRHRVAVAVGVALATGLGVAGIGLWRGAEQARAGEQLANAGREAAQRGERAALRASELSREVLRVTVGLFEAVDETAHSKDITVHELLDAAVIDERATRVPLVEQAVREVRGDAYLRLGRNREGRTEYERAVALQPAIEAAATDAEDAREARGHGHVVAARYGLALVRTGERERGDAMMRDALEAVTREHGELQRVRVLYTVCQYLGQENQDAELVDRARELRELAERIASPGDRLFAERWLAKALGSLQRHDEAKVVARSAYEQAKAHHGPRHRNTCAAHAAYVTVLQEAGDLDAAERAYPELLEEIRAVYGPSHESLLTTLNNQAHLLFTRGRREEALTALRGIVAVHEARGGAMTLEHLQAKHNLGQVLNMMARFAEAEPLLRAAAAASRDLLGPDDVDGAKMRFNHGACLAWIMHLDEAEPILLAEYATMARLLPAGHDVLAKSRRTIADAYRLNGKPEAAAEWRAK